MTTPTDLPPEGDEPTGNAPAARRNGTASRARWLAAAVLVLVGLTGVAGGVALDRRVLLPRAFERHGPPRGDDRGRGGRPSPAERARIRAQFARDLGLTPEQQPRVDSIMERQGPRMDSLRAENRRRFQTLIDETQRELETVLTPEQIEKYRTLQRRWRRPPGPDERGRGGGPERR